MIALVIREKIRVSMRLLRCCCHLGEELLELLFRYGMHSSLGKLPVVLARCLQNDVQISEADPTGP